MSLALLRRAVAWVLPHRRPADDLVRLDLDLLDAARADGADPLLPELISVLEPFTTSFGAAVAAMVARCARNNILTWAPPITAVRIAPVRDGFLVLVDVGDRITLASSPQMAEVFHGAADPAVAVLAAVVSAAATAYRTLRSEAARLAGARS